MKKSLWLGVIVLILLAGVGGYLLRGRQSKSTPAAASNANSTAQTSGTTIDYSGKSLTAFPNELLSNKSIMSLDLSNNQLTTLPAGIQNLANLQQLNVSNNRLTSISAEIGQLKHLKTLNFNNNRLTSLPPELGNLTQLQVLDISGNNLSQNDIGAVRSKLPNTQIKT